MTPPLRKRLGFADRSAETRSDRGVMARALMYAYAAGAVLAIASPRGNGRPAMVLAGGIALVCCAAAAILLAGYDDLPRWSFPLLVAIGTGLVALAWPRAARASRRCWRSRSRTPPSSSRKVEAAASSPSRPAATRRRRCRRGPAAGEVAVTAFALVAVGGLVGMQRANVNRLIWRLSDAAITDELTGLLNRRGFHELFETELERARRSGQPLSVIVGDIDHFKVLNDRFGHAAGDRALEQLSLILGTAKRRIDSAARIGGEEFAVILPDSDQHAAFILAERMRREVRETFLYEPYDLTVSLGVATFPMHGTDTDALVAAADEALYAAKALGRDRSVVWGEDLDGEVLSATGVTTPRSERHTATMRALAEVRDNREYGTAAPARTRRPSGATRERSPASSASRPRSIERVRSVGSCTTWARSECPTRCCASRAGSTRRTGTSCAAIPRSARGS